jgi:hypothetical protein
MTIGGIGTDARLRGYWYGIDLSALFEKFF